MFEAEDLLSLFFFARLVEFGLSASAAGNLACDMGRQARAETAAPADRIMLVRGTLGTAFFPSMIKDAQGAVIRNYDPEHESKGLGYPGLGRVLFTVDFYVSHVREMIADAIARERSILGEDD